MGLRSFGSRGFFGIPCYQLLRVTQRGLRPALTSLTSTRRRPCANCWKASSAFLARSKAMFCRASIIAALACILRGIKASCCRASAWIRWYSPSGVEGTAVSHSRSSVSAVTCRCNSSTDGCGRSFHASGSMILAMSKIAAGASAPDMARCCGGRRLPGRRNIPTVWSENSFNQTSHEAVRCARSAAPNRRNAAGTAS